MAGLLRPVRRPELLYGLYSYDVLLHHCPALRLIIMIAIHNYIRSMNKVKH